MRLSFLLRNFTVNSITAVFILISISYCGDLFNNTLDTGENLFSPVPLAVIAGGATLSFTAYKFENPIGNANFLPDNAFTTLDQIDNFLFSEVLPVTAGGIWIAGKLSNSESTESFGEELSRGLLFTYGIVQTLKWSTNRTRPNNENNNSFPSAHAAGAACLATVLWNNYGYEAGIPAVAVAIYTCFSRVNLGKHFISDVIMGAAIGTACGVAAFSIDEHNSDSSANPISLKIFIDTSGRITTGL